MPLARLSPIAQPALTSTLPCCARCGVKNGHRSTASSSVSRVPTVGRSRSTVPCPFTSAATRRPRRGARDASAMVSSRPEATRRELVRLARDAAQAAGRDPSTLEITLSCPEDLDELPALAKLGVHRVLVPVNSTPGMVAAARNPEGVLAWRSRIEAFA